MIHNIGSTFMRRGHHAPLATMLLLLGACSEPPVSSTGAGADAPSLLVVGSQPRTRLEEIGIGLATALRNQGARVWLMNGLAASPYVEDRIPLRRLFVADSSENVRTIIQRSGRPLTTDQLANLPELELYIPVKAHRAAATVNSAFQVAVRGHADSFYVIRPDGSAFRANEWFDPGETVTIALGRSEIQYDDAATAIKGGASTGTGLKARMLELGMLPTEESIRAYYAQLPLGPIPHAECDPEIQNCGGGGGGGPNPPPPGGSTAQKTYLALFRLNSHWEGLAMGSNEIEVFGYVNGAYASCAQLTDVWWGPSETVTITTANPAHVMATAIPTGAYRFTLLAYEDDNDRCARRDDDDYLGPWATGITINQYGQNIQNSFATDAPYGHARIAAIARP